MYEEKTSLRDVKDSVLNPSVVAVVPRVLEFLLWMYCVCGSVCENPQSSPLLLSLSSVSPFPPNPNEPISLIFAWGKVVTSWIQTDSSRELNSSDQTSLSLETNPIIIDAAWSRSTLLWNISSGDSPPLWKHHKIVCQFISNHKHFSKNMHKIVPKYETRHYQMTNWICWEIVKWDNAYPARLEVRVWTWQCLCVNKINWSHFYVS